MDSSLQEKYLPLFKQHFLPIALGIAGLLFLGYGLLSLSSPKDKKGEITFEAASDQAPVAKVSEKTKQIAIDVEGAVLKPGVYQLGSDSRVQDALIAAGGMSPNADRDKIAKGLNLAAKLTDGAKLYLPFQGDQVALAGTGSNILGAETGSVNLNTASEQELDGLAGIGAVTAQKIIANRPYGTIEELVSKKIVGKKVFDQIKEKITVY